MNIKVLGGGCRSCEALLKAAKEAVEKKGMVTVWCNDQIIDEREMTIVIPRERNILGIVIKFFKKLFR